MKAWQELECFLFEEMLICVKEKKLSQSEQALDRGPSKYVLKGSILIRKHLLSVERASAVREPLGITQKITAANVGQDEDVLSLTLSVAELPHFHLRFNDPTELISWQQAFSDLTVADDSTNAIGQALTGDDLHHEQYSAQISANSRSGAPQSRLLSSPHVSIDVIVVVPVSPTMQGVKIQLVRDALRFMLSNLGEHDRMGIVTFGAATGGDQLVGLTTKAWGGWESVFSSIRPVEQDFHRADIVVDGANVAVDLLMQRTSSNPVSSILLISDLATTNSENVDFVVSRAEAAKCVTTNNSCLELH